MSKNWFDRDYNIFDSAFNIRKFNRQLGKFNKLITPVLVFTLILGINLLLIVQPVFAHHPTGGKIPSSFLEGFLSGLGHPLIGFDHLVFVIAIGLLAALKPKLGMVIPLAFVLATAMGTGIHLASINLPFPEIVISASVLIMGLLLAKENQTNLSFLLALGAIAGIFHGYAYGESIIGAETTVLGAYLLGFGLIQLFISASTFYLGRLAIGKSSLNASLPLRFAGFTICGMGITFLSNIFLG